MNTEQPIYPLLQLKQYENPGGKYLTTDADGNLQLVDGASGGVYLTEADTAWVDITGTGQINIPDWQTDFNALVPGNMVEATIWCKIAGVWHDFSMLVSSMTFNGADTELQSVVWYLNADPDSIQKIKIRLR